MKGINSFTEVQKLKGKIQKLAKFSGISFRIVQRTDTGIIVEVCQSIEDPKNMEVFTDKRLRAIVKETFKDHTLLKIYPTSFKASKAPSDIVTSDWIKEHKLKYNLKTKTISAQLGVSKGSIKGYIEGVKPLTSPIRAMFYYYFESKKL